MCNTVTLRKLITKKSFGYSRKLVDFLPFWRFYDGLTDRSDFRFIVASQYRSFPMSRILARLGILFCAALAMASAPAAAQDGGLTVEMNKFEAADAGGCRAFFLFRNETGKAFEGFEMSLAILDGDGVIDRLLNIDAAPLPVARTTLKLFEIPELACTDISEVLVHAIDTCQPQNEENMDCFPMIDLVSRTSAALVK